MGLETPGQRSTAFDQPIVGYAGDTGMSIVPGQTPGTTPPFLPSPQGVAGGVDEQTKKILEMLIRSASQRKAGGTPRPDQVPGRTDPFAAPSYMTSGPGRRSWGAQRLMYGIGSMVQNFAAKHKEEQINKAMADWEYAQSALNEYYAAQDSKDPKAIEAAQKKVDVVFGDPKKLKNMAKALNQDWMNPEKTTVHGEALKRVAAETQQKDTQKQQAKGGIMGLFRKLIGERQAAMNSQLNEDERKRMEQEIIGKAPATTGTFNIEQVKDVASLERSLSEARQKYQYIPAQDGTIWAVNKNDRNDAHQLRDSDSGDPIKGKAGGKEGQVYQVNGMPVGVFHGGKPVMPGDPEWTERDGKMYEAAVTGAKEKQFLRVDPAIAAMVGDPPNPADYKKGRSDPEYGAALKKWGQEVFSKQLEKTEAAGAARAKAFNEYRPVQAMDAEGNVYYTTAKQAIEQGLAGAGEGIKLKPREAQINDIQVASQKTREAINALDKPFSPAQIAKLHYAMSTEDPSLANTELSTLATQDLTESQQDFVIWVRQLNERAMSLRNVAGMGVGAQDLGTAIRAMIPGIRSGSKQMMNKQLDAFDNQVKILKGGIAHPGKAGGTVKMKAPNGQTKDVPADQVQHYKDLGATVVQQ